MALLCRSCSQLLQHAHGLTSSGCCVCFPCSCICVWVCLWRRLLYCAGLLWPSLNGCCCCTCCPELPSWLSNVRPPPSCGCGVLFFFGAFFLSFYQCKPHGHAIMLPFTLLHGRPYYNPPHTVSVYHLFSSLWIIQKNIFHIRTLSLLLLHFLSLYLSNHSPHLSLSGVMVPTVV